MDDEQIALLSECLYLPGKYLIEPEVISGRGQSGCVGSERERGIRATAALITNDVLGREVLGVGGAAAIATEKQRTAAIDRRAYHGVRPLEILLHRIRHFPRQVGQLTQRASKAGRGHEPGRSSGEMAPMRRIASSAAALSDVSASVAASIA